MRTQDITLRITFDDEGGVEDWDWRDLLMLSDDEAVEILSLADSNTPAREEAAEPAPETTPLDASEDRSLVNESGG